VALLLDMGRTSALGKENGTSLGGLGLRRKRKRRGGEEEGCYGGGFLQVAKNELVEGKWFWGGEKREGRISARPGN